MLTSSEGGNVSEPFKLLMNLLYAIGSDKDVNVIGRPRMAMRSKSHPTHNCIRDLKFIELQGDGAKRAIHLALLHEESTYFPHCSIPTQNLFRFQLNRMLR